MSCLAKAMWEIPLIIKRNSEVLHYAIMQLDTPSPLLAEFYTFDTLNLAAYHKHTTNPPKNAQVPVCIFDVLLFVESITNF